MTEEQTPLEAALDDLLAQLEKKLGPVARSIVSANAAHITDDPEGGEKAAMALRDKARSARRGRGRKKTGQSIKEQVYAYYLQFGDKATLAHFEGKARLSTLLEYMRQIDQSQRK